MQANKAIIEIIGQINHVLHQLEAPAYRKPLPEFSGSSIGQHFRHILEFLQCLEQGLDSGKVDYAGRRRNLLYEDNPVLTSEAFGAFASLLSTEANLDMPLMVRAEFGSGERPEYASTFGRELLFVYDHAIHHLAIIKIGLHCHFPEINADHDLGVSPSTIKFRQATSQ